MAVTSEAVGDIALVAAVLSPLVPVSRERLAAMSAGEMIHRFPLDVLGMRIPPLGAAFVRAEDLRLALGDDFYQLAALLAAAGILRFFTQTAPPAE